MDFPTAAQLTLTLMATHGLTAQGWTFGWNRRKRSLGLCRYRQKRIELSAHFVYANDEVQVRETILHEIAHALAGEKAAHGPLWKAMCTRVGCKPERCDQGVAVMPKGRWTARCAACGKEYHRHRRPARQARYWCRACGPDAGTVTFAPAGPLGDRALSRSQTDDGGQTDDSRLTNGTDDSAPLTGHVASL